VNNGHICKLCVMGVSFVGILDHAGACLSDTGGQQVPKRRARGLTYSLAVCFVAAESDDAHAVCATRDAMRNSKGAQRAATSGDSPLYGCEGGHSTSWAWCMPAASGLAPMQCVLMERESKHSGQP
jgi:hypothetical protein